MRGGGSGRRARLKFIRINTEGAESREDTEKTGKNEDEERHA
jgi:hypothetical protein